MSLSTNEQMSVLMDLNSLSFSPAVNGSLANRRQYRSYAFQPLNYTSGQIAQIQVNSGSDFISGPTSYIICDVTRKTQDSAWSENANGIGSAFNIFNEFQISHLSVRSRTSPDR